MEIKDIQANQGNIDLVLNVVEKEEERTFEKFGKSGRVCKAKVKDNSGEIKLTLWNEDIDKVNVGDKIHLQNGWCSEYQGEKQLSSGKFGKIEIVEKSAEDSASQKDTEDKDTGSREMFTNDPGMLQGAAGLEPGGDDDDVEKFDNEEEVITG